jgi:hypothetical protein
MLPTRKSPPPPPLDGGIRVDDRARAAAADDFGHLVHRTPEGVLLPASEEDVAAAVRWAAEHGRTFAAQGGRHSVFGRDQASGGIVADMGCCGPSMRSRTTGWWSTLGRPGARCSRPRCRGGWRRPGSPTTSTCRSAAR